MARFITPGKMRGLDALSTERGVFAVLAIDHRDSLRAVLAPDGPSRLAGADVTAVKLDVLRALAAEASGVMLDPEYGAAQAIATRALPGSVGFVCALEAQGYLADPTARRTELLEGWGVDKAKRLGAAAVKLLVLYRPDAGAATEAQDEVIATVVAECARHDIPLFLEPLPYALPGEGSTSSEEFAAKRRDVTVASVARLSALRPDVLKVPFPLDAARQPDRSAWRDACVEVNAAAEAPWALLSGGDPFDVYREQVRVACAAGASGFMAGRAVWGDSLTGADRAGALREVALPRFRDLARLADGSGHDWAQRYGAPAVGPSWYRSY